MLKNKKTTIQTLAINEKDTGSSQVQIGLLSYKIEKLASHFKTNKKDKHSSQGLLKAVNKRKKLLQHLKKTNLKSYSEIIDKLKLRK